MTEYTKRGRNRKGGILGIRRDTPLVSDRRGRYGAGSNFRDLHASPRSHFFSSFQINRPQHWNSFLSQKKRRAIRIHPKTTTCRSWELAGTFVDATSMIVYVILNRLQQGAARAPTPITCTKISLPRHIVLLVSYAFPSDVAQLKFRPSRTESDVP